MQENLHIHFCMLLKTFINCLVITRFISPEKPTGPSLLRLFRPVCEASFSYQA